MLGILLNAVTIAAFVKVKELRTPSNFLVFSLAAADVGISMNATVAAFSSFLRYWPYGSDGCQTHGFQGFTAALASIHFVATIAWDRYHQNYVSYLIPMTIFNMVVQVFVVMSSYQSIEQKFKKTGNPRFNASMPLKTLLFCWGPYGILAFYAAIENATLVSPKLRMTAPTFNMFLYALGNENYRGGIWELLTGEKIQAPQIENNPGLLESGCYPGTPRVTTLNDGIRGHASRCASPVTGGNKVE
ncbi:hypothetical protein CRUP_010137 [Coryphaenoides rupestris]|nr:hypothetical protein CRUP_010137 [Coryphaenoides rupestris]